MSESESTPEAASTEPLDADEAAPDASEQGSAQFEAQVDTSTVFRVMNLESVVFDLGDPSPQVHQIGRASCRERV